MQHLNYCRQMVKQFRENMKAPNFPKQNREILSHAIDLASASMKFILPESGRIYDDPEYRALDENQELNLPFEFIALEYSRHSDVEIGKQKSTKAIVFARQRDESIVITPIMWADSYCMWAPMPEFALPRTGFIDKNGPGIRASIKAYSDGYDDFDDCTDEAIALLCFLNVLQCGNVHIETSSPKKAHVAKAIKKALPFDTYHILTIDTPTLINEQTGLSGGHRSPREHLRRGHIRRLSDGRKIWINATVVAAGRGAGVVSKDYRLRMHAVA